jgi:hypothetical protein
MVKRSVAVETRVVAAADEETGENNAVSRACINRQHARHCNTERLRRAVYRSTLSVSICVVNALSPSPLDPWYELAQTAVP